MKNLIPKFILKRYSENETSGRFIAGTMFIDISGFTAMTQSLMKNGKEGAEILTSVINDVFTPSIDAIYDFGGFISTFAGDAFTAVFPREHELALSSAIAINKIFENIGTRETKFGNYELSVKVGLSVGTVNWGIISGEHLYSYYIRGEAIDAASKSEHHCQTGEIIADSEFYKLNIPEAKFTKRDTTHYKLISRSSGKLQPSEMPKTLGTVENKSETINKSSFDISPFVPQDITDLKIQGEFRDIISCFISFRDEVNLEQNISHILNLTHKYGGYFNKLDFGDKGGVILVLFGAPTATEKMYKRACDFASEINQMKNFPLRTGLTFGTVFAGFVGSLRRKEYTALGMVVNLSARYMMKADWNEIYIDRFISSNIKESYEYEFLKAQDFKGFAEKIPVYKLLNKTEFTAKKSFEGVLIGRKKELSALQEFLKPIFNNQFGGIIYTDGVAGIGKSRLVSELHSHFSEDELDWVYLPCDDILKKSFNPFIHYFRSFFLQSDRNSGKQNLDSFNKVFSSITSEDKELNAELIRTRSFLAALVNVFWKGSLYEQVDAKSRYENTIYAVKNFIKLTSLKKPVILEFDDAHNIDSDSLKLLSALTLNVSEFPFTVIASSRPQDQGALFDFGLKQVLSQRLEVSSLSAADSKTLILHKFQEVLKSEFSKVPKNTFELILHKSDGNPFYIEQIILYLIENNFVDEKLKLSGERIEIPTQINSVIIARIDRLAAEIKETVKNASVLGKEFITNILSAMLIRQNLKESTISSIVSEAEAHDIWIFQQLSCIFKSTLIRESIYEIQLKKRLRFLHNLAAESIEEIYKDDIREHYSDLAFHYEKAESAEKAALYLGKSGKQAKYRFLNDKALDYFERKIVIIKKMLKTHDMKSLSETGFAIVKDFIDTLFEKKYLLQLTGKQEDAEITILKAKEFSYEINDDERIGKSLLDHANVQRNTGKTQEAKQNLEEAQEIFLRTENKEMLGLTYLDTGIVNFWLGKNDDALACFQKELQIFTELDDKRKIADALGNIGVAHRYKGNLKEAMTFLMKQRKLSEELCDKLQIARTSGNIGWIYEGEGDYDKALKFYKEALEINSQLGILSEIIRIKDNMGFVFQAKKDFDMALFFHSSALKSAEEIGDTNSIININSNIGHAYKANSKLPEAKKAYNTGIRKARESKAYSFLPELLIEKADLLFLQKEFAEAKKLCEEGLKYAQETNNDEYTEKSKKLLETIGVTH